MDQSQLNDNTEDLNYLVRFLANESEYAHYSIINYRLRHDYRAIALNACLAELSRLNLLIEAQDGKGNSKYLLKEPIKREIAAMPRDFEGRPYEYLLKLEQDAIARESASKWYTTENARLQFEDYPRVKSQARLALIIAGLSALAALLAIIL